jgi:RHH-type proline utilization regulon transcriptional repressor/proline dehydrogenase/delta 1-pyrroline-5-carboxylate dehydrogenase
LREWWRCEPAPDIGCLLELFQSVRNVNCAGLSVALPGPTGESNTYSLAGRRRVLCLAGNSPDLLTQLAAVLALGSHAIWHESEYTQALFDALPSLVRSPYHIVAAWDAADVDFDAVLCHGDGPQLLDIMGRVANRPGPIVLVHAYAAGARAIRSERLLVEKSVIGEHDRRRRQRKPDVG